MDKGQTTSKQSEPQRSNREQQPNREKHPNRQQPNSEQQGREQRTRLGRSGQRGGKEGGVGWGARQ
jgi:hypothetical protein